MSTLAEHVAAPLLRSVSDFNWEATDLKKRGMKGKFYMGCSFSMGVVWKYWVVINDKSYSILSSRLSLNDKGEVETLPFDTDGYPYDF
jgi:hypothetical protein